MKYIFIVLTVFVLIFFTSPVLAANLCQGLITDKNAHPMSALAKPAYLSAAIDPEFGTKIYRVSSAQVSDGSNAVVKPPYSTMQAWNADESLLLLWHRGYGGRHYELHNGINYSLISTVDIPAADIEHVIWDPEETFVYYYDYNYLGRSQLVKRNLLSGQTTTVRDFQATGDCAAGSGITLGSDPMYISWYNGSKVIGLICGSLSFTYDLLDDRVYGKVYGSGSTVAPSPAPSGDLFFWQLGVYDKNLTFLRSLPLAGYEHASTGRTSTGKDTYNSVIFSPVGGESSSTITRFDLDSGSFTELLSQNAGWPYPRTTTHISSVAYKDSDWIAASSVGNPAGQGVLEQEIILANAVTGQVCRVAHHHSYGQEGQWNYWSEPQNTISPSGSRIAFASDWGNGNVVDTFVVETLNYTAPPVGVADVSPPSQVVGLNATTRSISRIDLSWNASTDDVGVRGYSIYRNGTYITSTIATHYSSSQLKQNTTYNFSVVAYDWAGNIGSNSGNISSATFTDTQPPSQVVGFSALPITPVIILLSWNRSTDNTGVGGYILYRDSTFLGLTPNSSMMVSNLTSNRTYIFTIYPYDVFGNIGQPSQVGGITSADTTPPSQVVNLTVTAIASTSANLSWNASTDDVGVLAYRVYRNGVLLGVTQTTNTTAISLTAGTTYRFSVAAFDTSINTGQSSENISVTTLPPDTTAPSQVVNLTGRAVTTSRIDLSWNASTDNLFVAGYRIFRNTVFVTTTEHANFSDTLLSFNTTYNYTVDAFDAAANIGTPSSQISVRTLDVGDTTPPSQVVGVSATSYSSTIAKITWNATTDNVGVMGYAVYRNGINIGTVQGLVAYSGGLTPGQMYNFSVSAYDSNLNYATMSANASVTIYSDTQTPTKVENLTAVAISSSQINLVWNASSDNVAVFAYLVYRNGTFLQAVQTTSFNDSGLNASTNYNYTVYAYDVALNVANGTSKNISTLSSDIIQPDKVENLTAVVVSSSEIDIQWNASSDNVGVVGYRIYRNGVFITTRSALSYQSTGLSPSTTYAYSVAAYDADGNIGNQSNPVAATTIAVQDTTPSVLSNSYPKYNITYNQSFVIMSVDTDEQADCRYSNFSTTYALMNGTFDVTGGTSHSTFLLNLQNGTTYNYTVRCIDTSGNANTDDYNISFSTVMPAVDISSPENTTVSGTISVSAAATDETGITNVLFFIDNSYLGESTSSPYTISLDTTSYTNGQYSAYATVNDTSGNLVNSSYINFTIYNAAPAVPSETPAGSGGGGGGGGGLGVKKNTTKANTTNVTQVNLTMATSPKEDVLYVLPVFVEGIKSVNFKTPKAVLFSFEAKEVENPDVPAPGRVYKYFTAEVNYTNFTLMQMILELPTAWVEETNGTVVLMSYHDSWEEIGTQEIGSNETKKLYIATLPSFSLFAITSKFPEAGQVKPDLMTEISQTAFKLWSDVESSTTGFIAYVPKEYSLAGNVLLIAVLGFLLIRRRKK